MAKFTYDEIADFFIALSNESENLITNLKLQKLMYYMQAWYYTVFGEKLFNKNFEAWVHGPVIPDLYHDYKRFKWKPIDKDIDEEKIKKVRSKLSEEELDIFDQVISEYFGMPAYELERLTHAEDPWKKARAGKEPDELSNETIQYDWIEEYYSQFIGA